MIASNPRYRLDPKTLEMLVCPVSKTRLTLSQDRTELISLVARYAFPIRKGIPLLVIDAARRIDEDEAEQLRHRSSDI